MKSFVRVRCWFRLCRAEGLIQVPKGERVKCPLCGTLNVQAAEEGL